MENSGLGKLTYGQKQRCEGKLTSYECKKTLDKIPAGKSPRCDGLISDFYKKFSPIIGGPLIETLDYAKDNGELSEYLEVVSR